jgi:large subunit ribosomal protein L23
LSTDANKVEIKNAVEKQYGVNVEHVNTMVGDGKKEDPLYTKAGVLAGRKPELQEGHRYIAEGEVIDFYSNV